jgi:hypothetical protein
MQHKILHFLGSRTFFYSIVGVFALEAIWIALTGRYPGAFDENFHFGLIQLYARHWLPFLDAQPPNAEIYGAVARDPSYLYHYLMSFPYRFIALFTHSQLVQIIILRLINVAFAVSSLFIYAKILRRSRLPSHTQNIIFVLFTAIPVLPLLSGQINYDNMLLVLVAFIVLSVLRWNEALLAGVLSGRLLLQILLLALVACLVKYAFLPILLAAALFMGWQLIVHRQVVLSARHHLISRFFTALHSGKVVVLLGLLLLVGGLFFQRFGINVIRYHTPVPDCAQVISLKECSAYAPWQRDYVFAQNNTAWKREHIVIYANMWVHQMVRELYFTVYGAFFPGTSVVDYKTAEPLPFMIILGWTLLISGLVAIVLCLPKLWRNPEFRLFGLITIIYVGILFVQNYKMYVETAVPVAIHGRYLLPIVPLLLVLNFQAYATILRWLSDRISQLAAYRRQFVLGIYVVLFVACLQGGGILTHIVRSDAQWFWQENSSAQRANDTARTLLRPLIVEERL